MVDDALQQDVESQDPFVEWEWSASAKAALLALKCFLQRVNGCV
jgi:hypothetical protein